MSYKSVNEVIRLLLKIGYEIKGQNGSHLTFSKQIGYDLSCADKHFFFTNLFQTEIL